MDHLEVARSDEHRDDRHAAGDERLGLVGVERRRRDQVVVEPFEAIRQVVEKGALGLDHAREGIDEALGVVAGVGVRALGEEDVDERPRPLALGGGREGRAGELVGGEPGVGGPAEHLGHDARQGLGAASLGRPIGDVRPRAVATRDVPGVGQTTIDRPDRVGVHSQCRSEFSDRRQT